MDAQFKSIFFNFVLVIEDDDEELTSPFQGISQGVLHGSRMLSTIYRMPSDAFEPALPREARLARRICGAGGWSWMPAPLRVILPNDVPIDVPFNVCFIADKSLVPKVRKWAARQAVEILLIGPDAQEGIVGIEDVTTDLLRDFAGRVLASISEERFTGHIRELTRALSLWTPVLEDQAPITLPAHMIVSGNLPALFQYGVPVNEEGDLHPFHQGPYFDAVASSASRVLEEREKYGGSTAERMYRARPSLTVVAPAVYRHVYKHRRAKKPTPIDIILESIQKQEKFTFDLNPQGFKSEKAFKEGLAVLGIRAREMDTMSIAIALRAGSEVGAVVRVPPAVNKVAGTIKQMANHVRQSSGPNERKMRRLFSEVQSALSNAVGKQLSDIIGTHQDGHRLVSDVPLEWLPVGRLPMGLRFDVSRLTVTPGNLLIGQLAMAAPVILPLGAFEEVLVVSAFETADPIAPMLESSLKQWGEIDAPLKYRFCKVNSEQEFAAALNEYRGPMMVFDGHGSHREESGFGELHIGAERLSIWKLRGKVRVPPIVVLSACDTAAADRSHATTANGFLAMGAVSFLSTLLPVSADRGAMFICRLLMRIRDYVPAVYSSFGVAVAWNEFVSGMLRMAFVTDFLKPYVVEKRMTPAQYGRLHSEANAWINLHFEDWDDRLVNGVSEELASPIEEVEKDFLSRLSMSDCIRYSHLGNPDTISVVDPRMPPFA